MTQISVFNMRLVSTHYTLNYAIHGAFLRMVPPTDVYTRVGTLTLRLLMSYIYGAPSKARNANVVYSGCPRRNVKYVGRVFLMLNYTDITQNTYIQS